MLLTESGEFFSTDFPQLYYLGTGNLTFSGNNVTGTGQSASYYAVACASAFCETGSGDTYSGTIEQGSSLNLNGVGWTYDPIYNQPSSLAAVAGAWGSLTISGTGAVTWPFSEGSPQGACSISGQVSLINTSYNAYDIAVSLVNCSGNPGFFPALSGATGSGVLTIQDGPILYGGVTLNLTDGTKRIFQVNSPHTNQSIAGIWTAPATDLPGVSDYMLATADGRLFYYTNQPGEGLVTTGTLTVAGSAVTGTQETASVRSIPCEGIGYCSSTESAVSGTVSQFSTLTLGGRTWTYDTSGLYNNPSSLEAIANLLGSQATVGTDSVAYQAQVGGSGDCIARGQITLIDPAYNAYNVTLTYSGAGCLDNVVGATGSGIAYIDLSTYPVIQAAILTFESQWNYTAITQGIP